MTYVHPSLTASQLKPIAMVMPHYTYGKCPYITIIGKTGTLLHLFVVTGYKQTFGLKKNILITVHVKLFSYWQIFITW